MDRQVFFPLPWELFTLLSHSILDFPIMVMNIKMGLPLWPANFISQLRQVVRPRLKGVLS